MVNRISVVMVSVLIFSAVDRGLITVNRIGVVMVSVLIFSVVDRELVHGQSHRCCNG
jgi:hypothetical protein